MPKLIGILVLTLLLFPHTTYAVPPPDFIIQVASQIGSFFSIAFVFLLAILTTSYQFIKTRLLAINKKIYWMVGFLFIILIAAVGAYYYDQHYQKQAQKDQYQQWLDESIDNTAPTEKKTEVQVPPSSASEDKELDAGEAFIRTYYENLAKHDFESAYAVSKKTVSFEIFSSWYQNTQQIILNKIEKLDNEHYSANLTLWEDGINTDYQTVFTLNFENGQPSQIVDSKVIIIPNPKIGAMFVGTAQADISESEDASSFWAKNEGVDLKITNKDFAAALNGNESDYLVLDARENIEFENGFLPGATHIRFADIKAGQWKVLPKDKFIYVLCWSGMRGKEVAEYLRSQELVARYLENGSEAWVKEGGEWEGQVAFTKTYSADRYKLVFSTEEVKEKIKEGVKIVDSRSPEKFNKFHLPGSVNIPLMYTPTTEIEARFSQLTTGGKVITVCDDYVNCFDARLTGVELEKRGYEFLGRYNEPWKF